MIKIDNSNLRSAMLGGLVTAALALFSWGAMDRLSAESRIAKLEAAAEVNKQEHVRMFQTMSRLEQKIDILIQEQPRSTLSE